MRKTRFLMIVLFVLSSFYSHVAYCESPTPSEIAAARDVDDRLVDMILSLEEHVGFRPAVLHPWRTDGNR